MKSSNSGNMPVIAVDANIQNINILPGSIVTLANGIGPVIISNGHGITLNVQHALAPSIITSFADHFEIQVLGDAPNGDHVEDI